MFKRLLILVIIFICFSGSAYAGSISGTITYTGSQPVNSFGTIYVVADTNLPGPNYCNPCIGETVLTTGPGPYTIPNLPDGTYYVVTVMTANQVDSLKLTDPFGLYGGVTPPYQSVTIVNNSNALNIDITAIDGTVANPNPFYEVPLSSSNAGAIRMDPNKGGEYFITFWLQDPGQLASTVTVTGPDASGVTSTWPLTYSGTEWMAWNAINFGTIAPVITTPLVYTFTATEQPSGAVTQSTATITKFLDIPSPAMSPSGGENILTNPTFTWPDLGPGYRYELEVVDVTNNGWTVIWSSSNAGIHSLPGTSLVYPGPALTPDSEYIWQFRMTDTASNAEYWKDGRFWFQKNTAPNGVMNHSGTLNITAGDSIIFSGGGTDPEGDLPLKFDWNFDFLNGSGIPDLADQNPVTVFFNNLGTYTVSLTVTDFRGLADPTAATVKVIVSPPVIGLPPVSNPGGPYQVDEGGQVQLSGSASNDPDGTINTYAWDYKNDGSINATGVNPVFNASLINGTASGPVIPVCLKVTDNNGNTGNACTTVTVNNVAPTANAGGPYSAHLNTQVALIGGYSDPVDTATCAWDLNHPDPTASDGIFEVAGCNAQVSYATDGVYTVWLQVTDTDGAVATASAVVATHGAFADLGVLTFLNDTEYILGEDSTDPSCSPGLERGIYNWDPLTMAFSVTNSADNDGKCGLPFGSSSLSVAGDTLTFTDQVGGTLVAQRLLPSPTNPAVGSWTFLSPPFTLVPQATITVDGNSADWAGITPVGVDPAGDATLLSGLDLTAFYISQDADNIYIRVDRDGTIIAPNPESSNFYIGFNNASGKSYAVTISMVQPNAPVFHLYDRSPNPNDYNQWILLSKELVHNISTTTVELAIPKGIMPVGNAYEVFLQSSNYNVSNVRTVVDEISVDGGVAFVNEFFERGVFTALDNMNYILTEDATGECISGIERGLMKWDQATGAFSAIQIIDGNGECGLNGLPVDTTVSVTGDILGFTAPPDPTFNLTRVLASPTNPLVGSWLLTPAPKYIPAQSLIVTKDGTGTGTVTSTTPIPIGIINCGASCTQSFDQGTEITLIAASDGGSTFTGWSGGGCTGLGQCSVTLDAATAVNATFTSNPLLYNPANYNFTTLDNPSGLNSNATGNNDSGVIVGRYSDGTRNHGYRYDGINFITIDHPWGVSSFATGINDLGTIVGQYKDGFSTHGYILNGSSYTPLDHPFGISSFATGINDAGKVVGQYFYGGKQHGYVYDILTDTFTTLDYPGAVNSWTTGISDSGLISGAYDDGVTTRGYIYDGTTFWNFDMPGAITSISLGINDAGEIVGRYRDNANVMHGYIARLITNVQLTVSKGGTGGGTVSSAPAGIDCGIQCIQTLTKGTLVTLTATADAGSTFTGWTGGGCTGTGLCNLTLNNATTVTATFAHIPLSPVALIGGLNVVGEGSTIELNCSNSYDPDGVIVSCEWDLNGDNVFGAPANPVSFSAAGIDGPVQKTVRLRVKDNSGLTNTAVTIITVNNVDPVASANGPYTGSVGLPVDFFGTATDPAANLDPLTFAWDLDNDTVYETAGQNIQYIFNAAGVYSIGLMVTDDDGGVGTAVAQVTIDAVALPPVSSPGGPYQVDEGGTVALDGSGSSDPDGTIVSYEWDFDGDGFFDALGANPVFDALLMDGPSSVVVSLTVTDNSGELAIATSTVTVNNVAPAANANGPYSGIPGTLITLNGTATDPAAADTYTCAWDLGDANDPTTPDGLFEVPGCNAQISYPAEGAYNIWLQVTDKDTGVSAAVPAAVTVSACGPGTLHWNQPAPSNIQMHLTGGLLLDGRQAQSCDEVAVFDSGGQLIGSHRVSQSSFYGEMILNGDSPNTPAIDEGALEGDLLAVCVWDNITQLEHCSSSVRLLTPPSTVPGYIAYQPPLTFVSNQFNQVDIEVSSLVNIPVTLGWNFIGWVGRGGFYDGALAPAITDYASGSYLARSLMDNTLSSTGLPPGSYLVIVGPGGKVYADGSPFNNLKTLLPGWAYWVYANADSTLTLPGSMLAPTETLELPTAGWHQVSYWGTDGLAPGDAFRCIDGLYDVITDPNGKVYIPTSPFNNLNSVNHIDGYYLHTTGPATLTYGCP